MVLKRGRWSNNDLPVIAALAVGDLYTTKMQHTFTYRTKREYKSGSL
jgi:hypothetical protein